MQINDECTLIRDELGTAVPRHLKSKVNNSCQNQDGWYSQRRYY